MNSLILLMSITGSVFFLMYSLITSIPRKKLAASIRLFWLLITLTVYLIPFPLFKYLFLPILWDSHWSGVVNSYFFTENYYIYSHMDFMMDMVTILAWIWCLGSGLIAIIFTSMYVIRYFLCKRILKRFSAKVKDEQLKKFDELRRKLQIKQNVKLVESEYFGSPFTFGYFFPVICLPTYMKKFTEEEWDFAIRHELNHIKNKHLFINFLAFIVNLIHFYNPAAYWFRNEIQSMCEIHCDDKTIENYDTEKRRRYQEYILEIASKSAGICMSGAIGLFESKSKQRKIQRRVLEMNETKRKKGVVSAAAVLAFVLIESASVWAYEPTTKIEVSGELNPDAEYFISDNVNSATDLNSGDVFRDQHNNIYDTTGVDRAICFHTYVDTTLGEHTRNSDGRCVTLFYDAQRCTKCGYVKAKEYNGTTLTCEKCPH